MKVTIVSILTFFFSLNVFASNFPSFECTLFSLDLRNVLDVDRNKMPLLKSDKVTIKPLVLDSFGTIGYDYEEVLTLTSEDVDYDAKFELKVFGGESEVIFIAQSQEFENLRVIARLDRETPKFTLRDIIVENGKQVGANLELTCNKL